MLTCLKCMNSFKTVAEKEEHVQSYHKKPKQCNNCGEIFELASGLQKHRKVCQQPHKCPHCSNVSFKKQSSLEAHVIRYHTKKWRVFCPCCQKGFLSFSQMKSHARIIHGNEFIEQTKKCDWCENLFNISEFNKHKKSCQPTCLLCKSVFTTERCLKDHNIQKHTKKFNCFCEFCNKGFIYATKGPS